MAGKVFVLDSGGEEGWGWSLKTRIIETSAFHFKGQFDFQNKKERYWKDGKKYQEEHREAANIACKKWQQQNPIKYKATKNHWNENNPDKVKEMDRRKWNKRKRGLGFIELNDRFDGSNAHHIDKEFVLHIPKKLHQSVPHNIWNGMGMEEINNLACEYVYGVDLGGINRW